MWSSAIASSSPVVMPGLTASRSSSRVSPTTSPASRISAICSGDLISSASDRGTSVDTRVTGGVEGLDRALGDLVDLALRGDRAEQTELGVEADQRGGLLVVDLEPALHGLRLVVVALEQLAAVDVADASLAGGSNSTCQMCPQLRQVRRPDSRRTTSSSSTCSSSTASSGRPRSSSISLSASACGTVRGKPSSRKPSLASSWAQPVADDPDGDLVGHQVAGVHVLLGLDAEVGLLRDVGPEDVAGGDGRDLKCWAMNFAWVPLPAPGAPTNTTPHQRRNPS